jgi:hypothetical protein
MNFELVNFQTNDSERASQRRWQQVLDFGCPVAERDPMIAWQASVPVNPASDVMP